METCFCPEVHAWLTAREHPGIAAVPPPALREHVAGCARCREALLLLAADLLAAPLELASPSCDQCQDDLAAYIDCERVEGPEAAIRAYPHVWWHLWTCADCAESYHMVLALQAAEASGELPPIPLHSLMGGPPVRRVPVRLPAFTLRRSMLSQALVPHFGACMGGFDEDAVLYEDEGEGEGYEIRTSVRRHNSAWSVVVALDPPVAGLVIVTLGTASFRARLDLHGQAIIGPLPAELIASPDGPDLAIRIEPDDA